MRGVEGRVLRAGNASQCAREPGAKRTAIVGIYGEGDKAQVKIQVHAPPIEGRANAALIEFLAEMFGVPKNEVELVSGELSRSKVFLLRGATAAQSGVEFALLGEKRFITAPEMRLVYTGSD